MLRTLILILTMTAMTMLTAFAAPDQPLRSFYQNKQVYDGPFAAERIYQLNSQTEVYYASPRFETLADISCGSARRGLQISGQWTGNLSNTGDCLGVIEAPEYAVGNFLNFETSVKSKISEKD